MGVRFYASSMNMTLGASDLEIEEKARYYGLINGALPPRFWYGGDWLWDFDPLLGNVPRQNYTCDIWFFSTSEFNSTHKIIFGIQGVNINSQGMRQPTEVTKQRSEKLRLAFLGDSMTFGEEVITSLTYPNLFQEMLPDIEVLNFGKNGAGLAYMYLAFFNKTIEYQPDILIMTLFIHDLARDLPQAFRPYLSLNETGGLVVSNIPLPTHEEFLQQYTPPKLESALIDFIRYTFSLIGKEKRAYAHGMALVKPVLRELNKTMQGKFIVALLPFAPEDDPDPIANEERYQQVINILEEENIPYVNGKKVFATEAANYHNNNSYFYYHRGHLNPLGNGLFARALVSELIMQGIATKTNIPFSFTQSTDHTRIYFLNERGMKMQTVAGYGGVKIIPREDKLLYSTVESFAPLRMWCGFGTANRELDAAITGLMQKRRRLANLSIGSPKLEFRGTKIINYPIPD